MIPNEEREGWHYFAVKKLYTFLHGISSKHKGDFYCFNCLYSFRTENKLESYEKVCKNKEFCGIVMPSEKDNTWELYQYMKSDEMSYIMYADIESLIRKIDGCKNNTENSSTTKIREHIPFGYSVSIIWAFDHIENKDTFYCRKDWGAAHRSSNLKLNVSNEIPIVFHNGSNYDYYDCSRTRTHNHYRVSLHSETRTWHDENIQSVWLLFY